MIKRVQLPALILMAALAGTIALDRAVALGADRPTRAAKPTGEKTSTMNIRIRVGDKTLTGTLEDNSTSRAFQVLLPMTVQMTELNGNEKYFRLSTKLPTNEINPGTIQAGDLMIYGQNTLVLFYKTFPTSYSYTRLGQINDIAGLAAAIGPGSVTVTCELEVEAKRK
jgi:hypothetical protein